MAQAPLRFRRVERIAKVGVWGALRTPARDKSANDPSHVLCPSSLKSRHGL